MFKLTIETESDDRLCAILAVQQAHVGINKDKNDVGDESLETGDGHTVKVKWKLERINDGTV